MKEHDSTELKRAAAEASGESPVPGMWGILKENKKWWMLPMLIILFSLLAGGVLLLLSNTSSAPFLYELF